MFQYKEELRQIIFTIVESVNQYELSDTAKKLVLHYFNGSKASSTFERAMEAIERYTPEKLPIKNDRPPSLQKLIDKLQKYSDAWDKIE